MKILSLAIATLSLLTIGLYSPKVKAESKEKEVAKEELEKQNNENLIYKIESAQKEQFLKFMEKKQKRS